MAGAARPASLRPRGPVPHACVVSCGRRGLRGHAAGVEVQVHAGPGTQGARRLLGCHCPLLRPMGLGWPLPAPFRSQQREKVRAHGEAQIGNSLLTSFLKKKKTKLSFPAHIPVVLETRLGGGQRLRVWRWGEGSASSLGCRSDGGGGRLRPALRAPFH